MENRSSSPPRPRTFVVLVQDVPGVLDRVASLFRRRAYNIECLTVGHTDRDGVSHITIVMNADDRVASLVEANLYKVVNVLEVHDVSNVPAVSRDLALIKVRADHANRAEVMQVAEVFRARVVDVSTEALIFEITGGEGKIESLVDVLRPYGILEMARTGIVAMARAATPARVTEAVSARQNEQEQEQEQEQKHEQEHPVTALNTAPDGRRA